MSERNYLLPLVALAIGVFFLAVLVTGIVFWNHMPVIVSAPPVVATPTSTPTSTVTSVPTLAFTAETPPIQHPRTVPSAPSTTIPNSEASIARLRPGFRTCYNRGLAADPSLHGAITITIVVDASGDVTSVTKKSGGLTTEVDACIMHRARAATFDATPSGATLDVPLRFEHVN